MKRTFVIVGIVLGLVGTGAVAAWAGNTGPSQLCNDGYPAGTEQDVVTTPVALTREVYNSGGYTWVQACYSTTPKGSGDPEAAGGAFNVQRRPDGSVGAYCWGDRTTSTAATVECRNVVTPTDPNSSSAGATVTGSVKVGPTSPVNVGQTGAEAGVPDTAGGANPRAALSNTCVWVNGSTPAPVASVLGNCDADAVEMQVATGDARVDTRSVCVTSDASGCTRSLPAPYVATGGDGTNDTVNGRVADRPVTQDTGTRCVGVC